VAALEPPDRDSHTVVPLEVGPSVYAVPSERIATVLRLGALDGVEGGDTIDLGDHAISVVGAADVLCEPAGSESTVVVFEVRDDAGRHPGWLVDDVAPPVRVDDVETAAGAIGHVRGRIELDDETAVFLDPGGIYTG